jgi:hypothetical protein
MAAEVTLAAVGISVAPLPRVANIGNITRNVSIMVVGIASVNLSEDRSVLTLESASVYS